jgi:hypothetical protein
MQDNNIECVNINCTNNIDEKTENFIKKAKEKYGDIYDYSNAHYITNDKPVEVICKIHGPFNTYPNNFINKSVVGCPKCAIIERGLKKAITTELFISESKKTHGDKYDYSKVDMRNRDSKGRVCIICPKHGEFWQLPNSHMYKYGCKKCAMEYVQNGRISNNETFIEKAKKVHGDKYIYDKVDYKYAKKNVIITCPEHGDFKQMPTNHLRGKGCPVCGKQYSYEENNVINYVKSLIGEENVITKAKCIISKRKELDLYVPKYNFAIEFDGLIWHSSKFRPDCNYHKEKSDICYNKGINLIHIFEDEYIEKKELLYKTISNILGCNKHQNIIFSSQYKVKQIDCNQAIDFYNIHSLFKYNGETNVNYGIQYHNDILAVLSASKIDNGDIYGDGNNIWRINNIVANLDYNCIGYKSKLIDSLIFDFKPSSIEYYMDRRYNLLGDKDIEAYGFKMSNITNPKVMYTNRKSRYSNDEYLLIENKQSFYSIYDSGDIKYKFNC